MKVCSCGKPIHGWCVLVEYRYYHKECWEKIKDIIKKEPKVVRV